MVRRLDCMHRRRRPTDAVDSGAVEDRKLSEIKERKRDNQALVCVPTGTARDLLTRVSVAQKVE
jgi:hypothetical protein